VPPTPPQKSPNRFGRYDFIIIPGPSKADESRVFPDVKDGLYLGGQVRMSAALELSCGNPETIFIATGGFDEYSEKSAEVEDMTDFLVRFIPNSVVGIPSLPCTRHNLVAVFNVIGATIHKKRVALLTNFYHLPRALRHWTELAESEFPALPMPFPVCAESVALFENSLHDLPAFTRRFEREQRGMRCLEAGRYGDSCLGKRLQAFKGVIKKHGSLLLSLEEQRELRKSGYY